MRKWLCLLMLLPALALGRGSSHGFRHSGGSSHGGHSGRSHPGAKPFSHKSGAGKHKSGSPRGHSKKFCATCPRDKHGRIARSEKAKKDFMKRSGYPHGRRGFVIDHVVPLKKGGCDCPENMQWQTKEEAKAKDKIE